RRVTSSCRGRCRVAEGTVPRTAGLPPRGSVMSKLPFVFASTALACGLALVPSSGLGTPSGAPQERGVAEMAQDAAGSRPAKLPFQWRDGMVCMLAVRDLAAAKRWYAEVL